MAKTFGEKLREERERKKLTLEEVANHIGSTKSYVWELENKPSSRPSADKVFKLADLFEISAEYLIDEKGAVRRDLDQTDKAFVRKYQTLPQPQKDRLRRYMKLLDDE